MVDTTKDHMQSAIADYHDPYLDTDLVNAGSVPTDCDFEDLEDGDQHGTGGGAAQASPAADDDGDVGFQHQRAAIVRGDEELVG